MMIDTAPSFEHWRSRTARKCFKPCLSSDRSSSPAITGYGGAPLLRRGEAWPQCGYCKIPLTLLLQIGSKDLPETQESILDDGILQLFYCTENITHECQCNCWMPFQGGKLVRVIDYDDSVSPQVMPSSPFAGIDISGWDEMTDFPSEADYPDTGLTLRTDFRTRLHTLSVSGDDSNNTVLDSTKTGWTDEQIDSSIPCYLGDKLLGWAAWMQRKEYPSCTTCGNKMELLYQVESRDIIDYSFGDSGRAYLTQCPFHRRIVTFQWQCH